MHIYYMCVFAVEVQDSTQYNIVNLILCIILKYGTMISREQSENSVRNVYI